MHVCQDKFTKVLYVSNIYIVKIRCIAISEMKAMTNLKSVPLSVPYLGMN